MAQDYSEYLAVHVLNEQQYVSYRTLSRALKVHCNIAKQMLYEFHRKQNTKKPGSVHATYLLTGLRQSTRAGSTERQQDGDDTIMQSSPPLPSSSMPYADDKQDEVMSIRSIMLVKEEDLDHARALFDSISGIHIYSLEANTLKDVQVLTECNRKIAHDTSSEDPLKEWKQYGVIQNPNVKRRTGTRPPVAAAPPTAKPEAVTSKSAATAASKSSAAEINSKSKPSSNTTASEPAKPITSKPAALKKQESSIFKSFAKGAAAKLEKTDSQQNSAAPSPALAPAEPEDVPMTGFSDDDDEDGESGLPEELKEVKAPTGKSKKEREAELRAMMEEEDEPMEDAGSPPAESEKAVDEDKTESQGAEEPTETVTVENGRRRGKRRIMKKKTVKDEEGYLVTREEPAWESFSEEEPAPKKTKVQAASTNKPPAKRGAKPGQGNIMSFFSKK